MAIPRGKLHDMKDCIFCKIVAGEIPAYKVYENDRVYAFLDTHPVQKGHTLVVPKAHATNIFEISPEDWAGVTEAVRIIAGAIEKGVEADGVNLMMNNREHAGQSVFHAHVHLIPRFKGDGLHHWGQGSYKEGEGDETRKKISSLL